MEPKSFNDLLKASPEEDLMMIYGEDDNSYQPK